MADPKSLRVGDVVRSESFVRVANYYSGLRTKKPQSFLPVLELNKCGGDHDPTRKDARYLIIGIEEAFNHGGHNDPPAEHPSGRRILVKRLREDGSFDPGGETIRFIMSYAPYPHCDFLSEYVVWDDRLEVLGHLESPH